MEIKTLEHIDPDPLVGAFNQSFADYFVPIQLTREQLEKKMITNRVDLRCSVGAFDAGRLVGFVLHGYDTIDGQKTIYNAGTGVIPEKRGNQLTKRLYHFILSRLQERGIEKCLLEVIADNQPAIRTYQGLGFQVSRKLDCFKGSVKPGTSKSGITLQAWKDPDWTRFQSFWDWVPTWQHSPAAIEKSSGTNQIIGVTKNGQLIGYGIYHPTTGRVLQFAIDKQYRRQGLATELFRYMSEQTGKELSIVNVDSRAHETLHFLQSIGLSPYIKQLEMELEIKTTSSNRG